MPALGANELTLTIKAVDQASAVLKKLQGNVNSTDKTFASKARGISRSLAGVDAALSGLLKRGAMVAAAGSFGIGAAAKASWDQVSAVEQATVALGAYEKNGGKVSKVLSELVKYAKSDMGVLFQREDLFASAQNLKIMGDQTSDLTDHVKILSRSVGLGLSNWDDLNQIVGRVGSTGRLTGNDFDLLKSRGFKLDDSLRNTNVTWQSLFKALDKGMPANAVAGQAETIRGKAIRLQSAFRNLGNEFLGVDSATSTFIKGGLGDTLVGLFDKLIAFLKTPEMKEGLKKIGDDVAKFAQSALPLIEKVLPWLVNNLPLVTGGFIALAAALAGIKVVRFASDTLAATSELIKMGKEGRETIGKLAKGFNGLSGNTIPGVSKAFSIMSGVVSSPIAMPAIAVAAAIGAIALVIAKAQECRAAVQQATASIQTSKSEMAKTDAAIKRAADSGKISQKAYQTYIRNTGKVSAQVNQDIRSQYSGTFGWVNKLLDKMAGSPAYKLYEKALSKGGGGGWASGGFTGRGGVHEVAGVVHRGEYVIPQKDVDQRTGLPKATPASSGAGQIININIKSQTLHNDADMARFARQIGGQLA